MRWILLFFIPFRLLAQPDMDTTGRTVPTLSWDPRISLVDNNRVTIWGVSSGVIFGKKRHHVSLGYYWMNLNSTTRLINLRKEEARLINLDYYTKTDLFYFNLIYWPNLINSRRFRISTPVEMGIGATNNAGTNLINDFQIWRNKRYFIPVQAGAYAEWKATRYMGLSVQLGYRYSLFERNLSKDYSGLYYNFGYNLYTIQMYEDARKWYLKRRSSRQQKRAPESPSTPSSPGLP